VLVSLKFFNQLNYLVALAVEKQGEQEENLIKNCFP
jgi:hypothetical protein